MPDPRDFRAAAWRKVGGGFAGMRLGAFRVFYEVDSHDKIVWVKAIGRKEHNRLLIRGKEVSL